MLNSKGKKNGFQTIEYNGIATMMENVKININEIESTICKVALGGSIRRSFCCCCYCCRCDCVCVTVKNEIHRDDVIIGTINAINEHLLECLSNFITQRARAPVCVYKRFIEFSVHVILMMRRH